MNETLARILKSREDLSEFLFHFTSGVDAPKTLEKIINNNCILDIKNKGVLCFTEAPLTSLPAMFKIFEGFSNPMYSPYGIAVRRNYLYKLGGRPVINGLSEEKKYLHEAIQWQFEEFNPDIKDFTWLREWRIKSEMLELDASNFFIITKYKSELNDHMFNPEDVIDVEFDGCVADGSFWGDATGITARRFKGISIQDLEELELLSKNDIGKILDSQSFDDRGGINLGGFIM